MKKYAVLAVCFLFAAAAFGQIELYTGGEVVEYSTIQAAVDAAGNGDTVVIGQGAYTGAGNCDVAVAGKAIAIRSADPNDPNCVANTIIDCQGSETENHRGFYFHNFQDGKSVLAGLTIENGYAEIGGAVLCDAGEVEIRNCQISDCCSCASDAALGGGGLFLIGSNCFKVIGCDFSGNQAIGNGGAIHCANAGVSVEGCSFKNNLAVDGGAVFFDNDHFESSLGNCIFKNNQASYGAIINLDRGCLCNSLIYGNTGFNSVKVDGGSIINSTIVKNNGRGICSDSGDEILNCIVWGNDDQIKSNDGTNILNCCIQDWNEDDPNNTVRIPAFIDVYNEDYRLMEYSPCIDAGENSAVDMLIDLQGNTRIIDGDGDGVETVDIGAYEFVSMESKMPGIEVSTNKLQFRYFSDANVPDAQQFEVSNLGEGEINWQVTSDSNWVAVSPSCGTFDQDSNTITVSIDVNELAKDSHVTRLTIADVNDGCEPVEVRVYIYGFYGQGGQLIKVPEDYNNIQAAVDASSDGDTIVLADGTYTGLGNTDVNVIDLDITIVSTNGPDNCVIDCNGSSGNEHRAFYFDGADDTVVTIAGLKIMNSHFPYSDQRGAIGIKAGSPIVMDCNFYEEDWCPAWGYGIVGGSQVVIANCQISGFHGFALYGICGEILDCDIVGNGLAMSNIRGVGDTPGLMQGCNILNNQREDLYGGCTGIRNFYGDIIGCTIKGNYGALSHCEGQLKNCTIADNSPGEGVIYLHEGDLINCIIKNNGSESQPFRGGLIQSDSYSEPDVNIIGCEIFGNCFCSYGMLDGLKVSIIDTKILNNSNNTVAVLHECDVNMVSSVIAGNYASEFGSLYRCTGNISNCKIIGNDCQMYWDGSAICDFEGNIEDCDINWNFGGGVSAKDSNVVRCRFVSNDGVGCSGSFDSVVRDCVAYDNDSVGLESLRVIDCISIGNHGGGISGGDIVNCIVKNNTTDGSDSYRYVGGVGCYPNGNIINCIIQDNVGSKVGGISGFYTGSCGYANIVNCLVTGNKGDECGGINAESSCITNCTIVGNASSRQAPGIYDHGCDVNNCIIWDNRIWEDDGDVNQVYPAGGWRVIHCCIQGGWPSDPFGNPRIIDVNPYFARAGYWDDKGTPVDKSDDTWVQGDYHLKSVVGRYDEETQGWVRDLYSSFCIDTGVWWINEDWHDEPWPNGGRANMGFYGKTAFASKSGNCAAAGVDVNEDDKIDMRDFAKLAGHWLKTDLVEDPDSNGIIDLADIRILAESWLEVIY